MDKYPTIIRICDNQHPWVLSVILGCLASGIRGLTQPPNPLAPLDLFFPPYLRPVYYSALVIGSIAVLLAVWTPRRWAVWKGTVRDRLMLEQIGLWIMSMPLMAYPLAAVSAYGGPIGLGGFIAFLIGVGGLARIIMIIRELRAMSKAARV